MSVRESRPPASPCSERRDRGLVAQGGTAGAAVGRDAPMARPGTDVSADVSGKRPYQGNGGGAVTGNKLPKRLRVRTNKEFREAYEQDCAAHGRWMVVFRREGKGAGFRLGVVASRKVGGSPLRARAKRRLREAYRLNRRLFAAEQGDVIVVARRGAVSASWPALVAEFLQLARKAGFREAAGPGQGGEGEGGAE